VGGECCEVWDCSYWFVDDEEGDEEDDGDDEAVGWSSVGEAGDDEVYVGEEREYHYGRDVEFSFVALLRAFPMMYPRAM